MYEAICITFYIFFIQIIYECPIYTPNNTHPILRIREMYTDIYVQSYASHSTYQDTYTDIYTQSYAPHPTYENMYTHANTKIKLMRCSAKLSRGLVKPYGMACTTNKSITTSPS